MWTLALSEFIKKVPTYFKKFWAWVKVHGDIVLVVCIGIVAFILTRKTPDLAKVIAEKKDNYKLQVDAIEQSHAEEIEKRERAIERYHETIRAVEEKYAKSEETLDKKKKEKVRQIINSHGEDSDAITRELARELGFDIHVK
jgi:Sec-independent protein translocase protein TatA